MAGFQFPYLGLFIITIIQLIEVYLETSENYSFPDINNQNHDMFSNNVFKDYIKSSKY